MRPREHRKLPSEGAEWFRRNIAGTRAQAPNRGELPSVGAKWVPRNIAGSRT